jgi:hypothetical protein
LGGKLRAFSGHFLPLLWATPSFSGQLPLILWAISGQFQQKMFEVSFLGQAVTVTNFIFQNISSRIPHSF